MIRRARRPSAALIALSCLLLIGGCSNPAYWDSAAEGLAAANGNAYETSGANATEQEVCARYETRAGWSQGYSVTANVLSGSDLNQATGSYNYDSLATYAVIFWGQGEASVLKLQSYSGEITEWGTRATDQRDRAWKLSTTSACY